MIVAVKAVPRSRATRAVGVQDGALRVQIAAPPHDGRSNAALCAYLAGRRRRAPAAVARAARLVGRAQAGRGRRRPAAEVARRLTDALGGVGATA